jgi:hypothetical protein
MLRERTQDVVLIVTSLQFCVEKETKEKAESNDIIKYSRKSSARQDSSDHNTAQITEPILIARNTIVHISCSIRLPYA